jgi:putative transposase
VLTVMTLNDKIRRQLEYKSKLKGNILTFADRWFPSSKSCSGCDNVKSDLKLSDRTYNCEVCGVSIDRDYNAGINLEKLNQIPQVLREFTATEMTALLLLHHPIN